MRNVTGFTTTLNVTSTSGGVESPANAGTTRRIGWPLRVLSDTPCGLVPDSTSSWWVAESRSCR